MAIEHLLDASGLKCPMPILKAKKKLSTLNEGDILKIIATDPGASKDFVAFCNQTSNFLLSNEQKEGKFLFKIEKKGQ